MLQKRFPINLTWGTIAQGADLANGGDGQVGVSSGGHDSTGKGWEFGTALLNTAGQVIGMIDSGGNHVDATTVDHVEPTGDKDNNSIYYIIGGIFLAVFVLILFMISRKKA